MSRTHSVKKEKFERSTPEVKTFVNCPWCSPVCMFKTGCFPIGICLRGPGFVCLLIIISIKLSSFVLKGTISRYAKGQTLLDPGTCGTKLLDMYCFAPFFWHSLRFNVGNIGKLVQIVLADQHE